uniref:Uncharacterized protein n=1 Tax=Cannabis sativa TaxID=3483 RepID=A0A803PDU5_CANSA
MPMSSSPLRKQPMSQHHVAHQQHAVRRLLERASPKRPSRSGMVLKALKVLRAMVAADICPHGELRKVVYREVAKLRKELDVTENTCKLKQEELDAALKGQEDIIAKYIDTPLCEDLIARGAILFTSRPAQGSTIEASASQTDQASAGQTDQASADQTGQAFAEVLASQVDETGQTSA